MLIKAKTLQGYSLKSLDGEIGSASDCLFDDRYWAIRYLVANTGGWLGGRKVLISPYSLNSVNASDGNISVQLTKKQIEHSPSTDLDEPVSRQFETGYNGYYGYPDYWGGPFMWGAYANVVRDRTSWQRDSLGETNWDSHLRSTAEVTNYHLRALDGELGHVEDFIVDDETWSLRYLVVATKNWLPGKKVLLSTQWIDSVSWDDREVAIGLTREAIQAAPEYNEEALLTRKYETGLHGHYNRRGYWVEQRAAA